MVFDVLSFCFLKLFDVTRVGNTAIKKVVWAAIDILSICYLKLLDVTRVANTTENRLLGWPLMFYNFLVI